MRQYNDTTKLFCCSIAIPIRIIAVSVINFSRDDSFYFIGLLLLPMYFIVFGLRTMATKTILLKVPETFLLQNHLLKILTVVKQCRHGRSVLIVRVSLGDSRLCLNASLNWKRRENKLCWTKWGYDSAFYEVLRVYSPWGTVRCKVKLSVLANTVLILDLFGESLLCRPFIHCQFCHPLLTFFFSYVKVQVYVSLFK